MSSLAGTELASLLPLPRWPPIKLQEKMTSQPHFHHLHHSFTTHCGEWRPPGAPCKEVNPRSPHRCFVTLGLPVGLETLGLLGLLGLEMGLRSPRFPVGFLFFGGGGLCVHALAAVTLTPPKGGEATLASTHAFFFHQSPKKLGGGGGLNIVHTHVVGMTLADVGVV